jgi:hypothetical protein
MRTSISGARIISKLGWRDVGAILVCLFAALPTVGIAAPTAAAQATVQFSIQPASSTGTDPSKGAYFTYTLAPGASASDAAIVTNSGPSPVTLKLYAADGVTAIGGGTAFGADGERRSGVFPWLSTDSRTISAAPGERVRVPFAVRVPADAAPGDHVAGWVVEGPPRAGSAVGVQTSITERAGVAVVVRVPGQATEELAVADICMNRETGSNYLQVSVGNAGNLLSKASGKLNVTHEDGEAVFSTPVEIGTVLPADGTFIRADAPVDLGPGKYIANVTLRQSDGRTVTGSGKIGIGQKRENGCAAVSEVSGADVAARRAPATTSLASGSGGPSWTTIALAALAGLFAILLGLSLRRRPKDRSNAD